VQVEYVDVEVGEEVAEADIWAIWSHNTSFLRHDLRVYNLYDGAVGSGVDTEGALEVLELVFNSVADENDRLQV
jgi:hypothetical protein